MVTTTVELANRQHVSAQPDTHGHAHVSARTTRIRRRVHVEVRAATQHRRHSARADLAVEAHKRPRRHRQTTQHTSSCARGCTRTHKRKSTQS
jgi:hypothetical protein